MPSRVHDETKYLDFLRVEDMDPNRAAQRIALYWKYRRETFGEARWLLRLAQNGAGALSKEDLEHLHTGIWFFQQRPGREPVMVIDGTRAGYREEVQRRIAFYFAYVFAEESFQTRGVKLCHIISSGKKDIPKELNNTWARVLKCLPFKVQKSVYVQAPEQGKEIQIESMAYQCKRINEFRTEIPGFMVAGKSAQEIFDLLAEHGIYKESIPVSLGGALDYSAFYAWVRERQRLEDAVPGTGIVARASNSNRPFGISPPLSLTDDASSCLTKVMTSAAAAAVQPPQDDVTEAESRKEFLRKRNAMYVRRFYKKRSMEIIANENQIESLQARNAKLRAENRRLEEFLVRARLLAAQHANKHQS